MLKRLPDAALGLIAYALFILIIALPLQAGTITGTVKTPTGGLITNGTMTFTLSQPAVVGAPGTVAAAACDSGYVVTGVQSNGTLTCSAMTQPVDVGVTYNSAPTASLVIVRHPFPFAVTIPADCTHSRLIAETAATAETVFSLQKCTAVGACTEFGTATFTAAGTSATFSCSTATSFAEGNFIKVIAPASPDASLALIGGAIYGTRAGLGY